MRNLGYPDTDVVILCFAPTSPATFVNVDAKWIPEIHHRLKNVPMILVGTKSGIYP